MSEGLGRSLAHEQEHAWLALLPHREYYKYKGSTLQLTTGYMAAECQALLNEYVRRTGARSHLATNAA